MTSEHSSLREMRLGDFVELKRGYDLPQSQRRAGLVPVVSSSGISGAHDEAMVKGPGVVTGRYGTLGEVFFVEVDFWPLNTTLYVKDFRGSDPRFVSYFLQTIDFFSCSDKAAVPGVNRNHLHELRVRVPCDISVQREIAAILGALDDKIELYRRINQTLEAIAQALFKSWFVDFDPVRAKAEGRKPECMDAETDSLFPSGFQNDVPEGWRTSTLGAEAVRRGGFIQTGPFGSQLHASDYKSEGVPVVMPQDIKDRRISTNDIARIQQSDVDRLSRHRLCAGDLVYSRRGDVERHALVGKREEGWLCGTGCLLVRLGNEWLSPLFASLALSQPEARNWIVSRAVGATMPNLNTGILREVPILVPPDALLRRFDQIVAPLDARIIANDAESAALAALRDTLLPKLLSGEIRVRDAEAAA